MKQLYISEYDVKHSKNVRKSHLKNKRLFVCVRQSCKNNKQ